MLLQKRSLQGDKYIIEKILGQGGFGITYLAEQTGLNRKVAIKEFFMKEMCDRDDNNNVICTSPASKEIYEKCKAKFKKEAQMIASFDNPHIVRIHDVFEENATIYYVMEFIEGQSLQAMIDAKALEESVAISYIKQVAEALSYIHKRNVLHLDVKPANILINKDNTAILIDFGISKGYSQTGTQTSSSLLGLSKGYAPIEQYSQDVSRFSPATDIYSLGATLLAMLTGENPPEAINIVQDGFPPCPKNVNEALWEAIKSAMSPKIENRPTDVEAFLSLLNHRSENNAKSDNNETVISLKSKNTERQNSNNSRLQNKRLFIAIVAFMVLGVAACCGYLFYNEYYTAPTRNYIESYSKDVQLYDNNNKPKFTLSKEELLGHSDFFHRQYPDAHIIMVKNNEKSYVSLENVKDKMKEGYVINQTVHPIYGSLIFTYDKQKVEIFHGEVTAKTKNNKILYTEIKDFEQYYQDYIEANPGAKVYMFSPKGELELINIEKAKDYEDDGYKYN